MEMISNLQKQILILRVKTILLAQIGISLINLDYIPSK